MGRTGGQGIVDLPVFCTDESFAGAVGVTGWVTSTSVAAEFCVAVKSSFSGGFDPEA